MSALPQRHDDIYLRELALDLRIRTAFNKYLPKNSLKKYVELEQIVPKEKIKTQREKDYEDYKKLVKLERDMESFYKFAADKYTYEEMRILVGAIDKDNVFHLLKKYGTEIIAKLDDCVYGWGCAVKKKELLLPLINALADAAAENGVKKDKIIEFRNICVEQELNAVYCTDEKVIIAEVQKMLDLLD